MERQGGVQERRKGGLRLKAYMQRRKVTDTRFRRKANNLERNGRKMSWGSKSGGCVFFVFRRGRTKQSGGEQREQNKQKPQQRRNWT